MDSSSPDSNRQMERILKYSALIYAFLLFIGYSYIDTYYRQFGIDIFSFLDASEILISFLSNITILTFIFILIIIFYILPIIFVSQINLNKPVDDFVGTNEKRKKYLKYIDIIFSLAIVIYCIYQLVLMIVNGTMSTLFAFIYVFTGIIFYLIFRYLPYIFEKRKVNVNRQLLNTILGVIFICFFNFLTAIFESKQVENKNHRTDISFDYDSKTYKSSDSLIFVGATSKYIFIRNLNIKMNYVFEKGNMKNLSISVRQTKKEKK